MANREPIGWITVKGKRVPLFEGESKEESIRNALGDKAKQIDQNKKEADKKNAQEKQKIENFGNSGYKKEIVTYEGKKMPREEAKRIDKIKDDLGYLSYRSAKGELSQADKDKKSELQKRLRTYGKKYGISVARYLPGGK